MTEFIHVPNYGFLQTKVPADLFIKLKKECKNDKKLKKMKSGLSGKGVPKHFFLNESFPQLKEYVLQCAAEYEKKFNYIKTLKFLNKNAHLFVTTPWVNVQKQYEFLPMHNHDGILSYNIWIQVPYDSKKELKDGGNAARLHFVYPMTHGGMGSHKFNISKEDEGKLIMFPSSLSHALYPFYTSKGVRLSIAGNIALEVT